MEKIKLRQVSCFDTAELLRIYTPYVLNTAITFEHEVPSSAEFENRILTVTEKYPYLAAVINDTIVGYAYASSFKDRAAYDWSVETTVYIAPSYKQQGIGQLLYSKLEQCLRQQNICNLCACIAFPNPESISFHESFGYRKVAHFHRSGFKFDRWYDMVWMEKTLNSHTVSPAPFLPFMQTVTYHTL